MFRANSNSSLEWQPSRKALVHRISILDLPRELRDLIYEHVFRVSGAIFLYTKPHQFFTFVLAAMNVRQKNVGPPEPVPLNSVLSLELMRTCHQIHSECSSILYGRNIFRLYMPEGDFVSARYAPLVRHVTLVSGVDARKALVDPAEGETLWESKFWPGVLWGCQKLLTKFPNLQDMTFLIHASGVNGIVDRPYFINFEKIDRTERIKATAAWLQERCWFSTGQVRQCLHLELAPPPPMRPRSATSTATPSALDYEMWDITEFSEAFELMKRGSIYARSLSD